MRPETKLWLESATYDLGCAEAMLREKKYNYTVFFCHQCLEKTLKAILLAKGGFRALRTHDLKELYIQSGLGLPEEMVTFLFRLNPHYMVTRYPDMSGTAGYENYNQTIAKEFLEQTKKVETWLRKNASGK